MKKNLAITFWVLYMLFFAIAFPMILYYAINSDLDINDLKTKDPYWALGVVLLSVILWLILLIGYLYKWIIQVFVNKNNLEKIKLNGLRREAEIISSKKSSKFNSKFDNYQLKLCFKNLANTEIIHNTDITDTKPSEKRFEAGKHISLLLDKHMKKPPYFVISSATPTLSIGNLTIRILGWLFFTFIVVGYYFFSYQTESHGMGWRFMSFGHPLVIIPLVLLFYRVLVQFIFKKLTGIDQNSLALKFKGIKTQAKLIKVSQTGTYINEQPMMRFELEYKDTKNLVHQNSLKKVIGILDLEMTKKQFIDIFYNPENPNQIAFANDLNKI
ncbi:hypothetical protein LPB248_01095 [Flavobacterium sp. LPB0248]|uniref:hypothetical protein n=1 Tax=Flavobacterium sp. LPB0248 TaxID=2614441 RepID=UPI0015A5DE18|nr:hypothetical protein [Flavobacterium sp. LPB0248]QLC64918.1 hypothetical protein LPB248_01095 [Flavobacterium sp. LPB0248]